ncbi:hypothetical protein IU476_18890 [Nocardia blacklockiae]|nr:hypothetical protein [Nocardia blacklockiae]
MGPAPAGPGAGPRVVSAGQVRGGLTGAAVAVLAVAAHGLAGGGRPGSTALTLLVLAATVCGVAAGAGRAENLGRVRLFGMLAGGQLAGHAVLTASVGHDHGAAARGTAHAADLLVAGVHLPAGWMLCAHVGAAVLGALLIHAADRLYRAVSQAVRTITGSPSPLPVASAPRWQGAATRSYRFLRLGALGPRAPPVPA